MRFSNTLAFLALTAFSAVKAQEVESEDIESPCQSVCSRVVDISAQCDTDDDERELNCICGADGAREQIPLCEACIASVGDEDGDGEYLSRQHWRTSMLTRTQTSAT